MFMYDVNPLHDDGTPKSPEEIEREKIELGNSLAPGSQTDPTLLLKSLQEEREKRRIMEEEIQTLKDALASPDITTDDGRALARQINELQTTISQIQNESAKKDLYIEHPLLFEKKEDFEKYLLDPENKGMSLKTAARAFLADNGLTNPKRKGLEPSTGGPRQVYTGKLSIEEVKILRETNFKKYQEMLAKGEIEV